MEQEKRERKKQKEKERKERLKKEGKLLTKSQREARARAEATLKLLQAQGKSCSSLPHGPDASYAVSVVKRRTELNQENFLKYCEKVKQKCKQ